MVEDGGFGGGGRGERHISRGRCAGLWVEEEEKEKKIRWRGDLIWALHFRSKGQKN